MGLYRIYTVMMKEQVKNIIVTTDIVMMIMEITIIIITKVKI
jgi:hypothetical protein